MARPRKVGLEYFPLDVDFFNDEKMVAIHGEFGMKGQIIALHLLCAIYRNGYFVQWDDMLLLKIASATGLGAELVRQVVQRLVRWSFFDEGAFNGNGVLTSRGIQRRYFSAVGRRVSVDKNPHILVSAAETPVSVDRNPSFCMQKPPKRKVNKNNILSDDNIFQKAPPPPPPEKKKGLFEKLKSEQIWAESVCMSCHVPRDGLDDLIDEFELHCTASGKCHLVLSEVKSHFCNWLRRRMFAAQNNSSQSYGKQSNAPAGGAYKPGRHNPRRRGEPPAPDCGLLE